MSKKIWIFVGVAVILLAIFAFGPTPTFELENEETLCPFCNTKILNDQQFYEDELVIALVTHKPISPGHVLIIPKRHVLRFEMLTGNEVVAISHAVQKVHRAVSKVFGTSSYLLLQKNGVEAGQSVPHVHVHYIPRRTGDNSVLKFFFQFFLANLKSPLSPEEMSPQAEQLKNAMRE